MNRSTKYNFYLPQNTDPIDVSNFDYNFEVIDENLLTEEQSLTSTQKSTARTNLGLGDAALKTVANNLTTTSTGKVLDARQGKALNEKATANANAVTAIENGLAVVSVANTHVAISAGQYVYVREHSTLSEGLYIASSNISANGTLSTSNLTAVSGGGLNSLSDNLSALVKSTFVSSSVDLNTLVADSANYVKRWRGDTCANLSNAPSTSAIPWELTAGIIGSNSNYQYQEFRLYQDASGVGSLVFRRQKYLYASNDYRWNNWTSESILSDTASGTTDANGNLNLNYTYSQRRILSIVHNTNIATPFIYNGVWHVHITDSTGNKVAGTAVSDVYYMYKLV